MKDEKVEDSSNLSFWEMFSTHRDKLPPKYVKSDVLVPTVGINEALTDFMTNDRGKKCSFLNERKKRTDNAGLCYYHDVSQENEINFEPVFFSDDDTIEESKLTIIEYQINNNWNSFDSSPKRDVKFGVSVPIVVFDSPPFRVFLNDDDIFIEEGFLSSSSDFIELNPCNNHEKSIEVSKNSPKTKTRVLHEPMQIIDHVVPSNVQSLRKVEGNVYHGKKANDKFVMEENNLLKKLQSSSKHQASSQKPMKNVCVAATMGGSFRPMFTEFKSDLPKIYWMSFPGFMLSPFELTPTNIEEYLLKQKKKQESGPNIANDEAIAINYCEICKAKFTDALTHRNSDLHQQRSSQCNWKELDQLFEKINERFLKY